MAKISIIVPVYNSEKYLKDSLDSLVNQTLEDIEIIVVDDASNDRSLHIINDYAKRHPNIKVYHNKENKGQGASRNIGLEHANGEYIGFVDSDDYIEKTMYESMYESIEEYNFPDIATIGIDFVKDSDHFKDEESKPRWDGKIIDLRKNPQDLIWESPSCCNKLFKKDLIDNYRFLENATWEDIAFTNVLLMKSNKLVRLFDNFYHYRRDITKGVSSKGYIASSPLDDIFKVADEIKNKAIENGVYDLYKDYVSLIQIAGCFQRLEEINKWNIDEDEKGSLLINFYLKVQEKYGSWKELDTGLLSSKVDLFLLEDIDYMINQNKKGSK